MSKQIKRAQLKSPIHIVSNAGFLQVYTAPLSLPSCHALADFSGESVVVVVTTLVAVEE
jgi:hypothetical protein